MIDKPNMCPDEKLVFEGEVYNNKYAVFSYTYAGKEYLRTVHMQVDSQCDSMYISRDIAEQMARAVLGIKEEG